MRYLAFLRGVYPANTKMSELAQCFESAGFTAVRTLLASGNVAFDSPSRTESQLERKIEAAMTAELGRTFFTIVRPTATLQTLIATDPYRSWRVPAAAK